MIIGVNPMEKAEHVIDQLKGFSQIWFNRWNERRQNDVDPLDWEKLKIAFLYKLFPPKIREENVLSLINLCQESMILKEYVLNFMKFSQYVPTMIADQWKG